MDYSTIHLSAVTITQHHQDVNGAQGATTERKSLRFGGILTRMLSILM